MLFLQKCFLLFQQVVGARPAANVTWYNSTEGKDIPLQSTTNDGRYTIKEESVRNLIFNHNWLTEIK